MRQADEMAVRSIGIEMFPRHHHPPRDSDNLSAPKRFLQLSAELLSGLHCLNIADEDRRLIGEATKNIFTRFVVRGGGCGVHLDRT
jgi:hypothetical protein